MFPLEGIGKDVTQFITGCDRLLSALTCNSNFSEPEKEMILHYSKEIMVKTQALKDEIEEKY